MSRRKSEPKPSSEHVVLVIGMDLSITEIQIYRMRGALVVLPDWLIANDEIPSQVTAVWVHADLKDAFKEKFRKDLNDKRFKDGSLVRSGGLQQLRGFLNAYLRPLPEPKGALPGTGAPEARPEPEVIDLRREIGRLETLIAAFKIEKADVESSNFRFRKENLELIQQNEQLRAETSRISGFNAKYRHDLAKEREKVRQLEATVADLERRIGRMLVQKGKADNELATLRTQHESLQQRYAAIRQQLSEELVRFRSDVLRTRSEESVLDTKRAT